MKCNKNVRVYNLTTTTNAKHQTTATTPNNNNNNSKQTNKQTNKQINKQTTTRYHEHHHYKHTKECLITIESSFFLINTHTHTRRVSRFSLNELVMPINNVYNIFISKKTFIGKVSLGQQIENIFNNIAKFTEVQISPFFNFL